MKCLDDFTDFFAHTEDQVAFGNHPSVTTLGNDIKGTFVCEGRSNLFEDSWDRLYVVCIYFGLSVKDFLKKFGLPEKSGIKISTPVPGDCL